MTNELSSEDVRGAVFAKAPMGSRGYEERPVRELLQLAARRLDGRGYLSAEDVRAATLRTTSLLRRGYAKAEVDAFLERVVSAIEALEP